MNNYNGILGSRYQMVTSLPVWNESDDARGLNWPSGKTIHLQPVHDRGRLSVGTVVNIQNEFTNLDLRHPLTAETNVLPARFSEKYL